MKLFKAVAFILAAVLSSLSLASPVIPVGEVQDIQVGKQSVRLKTANAHAELTVYSPTVLRVRIDRQALKKDFSYAVVAKPQATPTTITRNKDEVLIRTSGFVATVKLKPYALKVATPDGKLLSQDEPGLATSWIGDEVTTYKTLQEGERFIGLGEKTGNLDRRGSAYTNWNTDAFRYTEGTDPLYASIPFYMGVHGGQSYGIFLDNSYRSDFNFGASNRRFSSFAAHGGEMNYYVFAGPSVQGIIGDYTWLTGRMPMPPLWSLGYQQNRYSYTSDTEVMRIAQTLREKQIPADGITLDIHYMDKYKVFTWDKQRFADPAGLARKLDAMGIKLTVIVDPGVKVEPGDPTHDSGVRKGVFAKYPDGSNYSGEVWPGWCYFPDFTSPQGRAWWAEGVASYAKVGVEGLWNDMNEIATWGQTMPNNVLFDFDGRTTTHKEARNVYALNMTRASYEGMRQAMGRRPFMLTRAGFAGSQRYTAMWTGDNRAEEEHMLLGVRLLNSLGLSGMAFTGMDVGGFTGTPTQSLYAKWMQVGAFTPYFRNHSAYDTKASEPWTFGDDVLNISREYVSLRYRLMPYLYSSFHEASSSGMPVMRSLAIDYTHDPKVYAPSFQNQYLFGPAFLVMPFESTRQAGKVYFPPGRWYNFHDDSVEQGGEKLIELSVAKLPVYVKAGSIVPMQSQVQSTAEAHDGTLVLHVYRGDSPSSFSYYEDDGKSFANEKGGYFKRTITLDPAARRIDFGKVEGSYASRFSKIRLVPHGFDDKALEGKVVSNDSKAFSITY